MIATSPLTGRIFSGRTNKSGNTFVGEKKDVTSEFFAALFEKAIFHGGAFVIEGGGEKWSVTVSKEPLKELSDAELDEVLRNMNGSRYRNAMRAAIAADRKLNGRG